MNVISSHDLIMSITHIFVIFDMLNALVCLYNNCIIVFELQWENIITKNHKNILYMIKTKI